MTAENLPLNVCGIVVKGFGRGSKDLGIPTANFEQSVVDGYSEKLETGVYYGWARVDNGEIYKMAMSVGWNPFYKNQHKSMETHIIHKFTSDFYGSVLRVTIVGYIRPEMDFDGLDALVTRINEDIAVAEDELNKRPDSKLSEFLTMSVDTPNKSM